MKRLLAILLACVLCLSTVFTLVACGEPTPPAGPSLDDAYELFTGMYEGNNGDKTQKDYNLPAQLLVDGVKFPVTYTVDNQNITITLNEKTGFYVVDLPAENAEQVTYTITATIADADGNTKTYNMTRVLAVYDAAIEAVTELTEETAYKIFLDQKAIGKVLFVTAEASGTQYLKTNVDPKAAPDFFVEEADGGFKVYTEVAGTKMYMYLTAAPRAGQEGKFDKAIALSAENASVLKYNAEINAWYTDIVTNPEAEVPTVIGFAAGTYGDYDTLCISETSYFTPENTGVSQFPMQFILKADGEAMAPTEGPADPTELSDMADLVAKGSAMEHNTFTVEKYLVKGVITEIKSTQYGNMYISDGQGNQIYIYGLYSADGSTRYDAMDAATQPQVGDTITVMAAVGKYNNDVQMKNARLIERTAKEWTPAEKVAHEKDNLTVYTEITTAGTVKLPAVGSTHPTVTITWAFVGTTDVATLDGNTLTVATLPAEETTFKVKATLTLGEVTAEKEFTITVAAQPQFVPSKVEAPVVGTGYYFALTQGKINNKFLYFNGTESKGFLGSTANVDEAVKVFVEEVTEGSETYRLYFDNNGTKTYIELFLNSSNQKRIRLVTEATAVWTWNEEYGIYVSKLLDQGEEKDYYIGTYEEFETFSASGVYRLNADSLNTTQFVAYMYEMVDLDAVTDEQKVTEEKDLVTAPAGEILEAGTVTLDNVPTKYSDVVITWALKAASDYATLSGNTLTITALPAEEAATVTLVVTLTLGEETATKEFTITIQPATLPTSTIAQAHAATKGTTVKVVGTVVVINGNSYMVSDETGTILVYTAANGLTVGDVVTIEGALDEYNNAKQFTSAATVTKTGTTTLNHGTPVEVDAAKIDAAVTAGKLTSEYVKLVGTLSVSGNYFNLTVEGTTNQGSLYYLNDTIKALATSLNGKKIEVYGYSLYISGGKYFNVCVTSIVEVQGGTTDPTPDPEPDPEPSEVTIAEALASAQGALVKVQGTVVAVSTKSFLVKDATGAILVFATPTVAVGDTVTVSGALGAYSGVKQFTDTATVTKTGTTTVDHGTPTVLDGAALDAYLTDGVTVGYVKLVGTLAVSGNYYNLTVEGAATAVGSLSYPAASAADFNGKNIEVYGYALYVSGTKYVNVIVTNIVEVQGGTTDPTPDPDPEPEPEDDVISITEANAIAATKSHNTYTTEKYIIEGVITEIQNTTFGNMIISDGTNSILIYGVYTEDGTTKYGDMEAANRPQVGDTIKVIGTLGTFSGTNQMKNGWMLAHTAKVWTDAEKVADTKSKITIPAIFTADGSIALPANGERFDEVTVTWTKDGVAYTDPTLAIVQTDAVQTIVLVATITCGEATDTKEFTVEVKAKAAAGTESWVLVTDASQLTAGAEIVIVAKDYAYAIGTNQKSNNRAAAAVTKSGNTVTFGDDVQVITLEAGSTNGTWSFHVTGTTTGYLGNSDTGNNRLKTLTAKNDFTSFNITVASDGVATVNVVGNTSKGCLKYNNQSTLFACYGSGQADICIYVKTIVE